MIGDIIRFKHINGNGITNPHEITCIDDFNNEIHADGEIYDLRFWNIEPIPLTPEILEKNGWSKDTYSNESYDNEDIECLSLWVGEDGKNKWWWHVGYELVTPINYVHQLQHALRLCEIGKEIIL